MGGAYTTAEGLVSERWYERGKSYWRKSTNKMVLVDLSQRSGSTLCVPAASRPFCPSAPGTPVLSLMPVCVTELCSPEPSPSPYVPDSLKTGAPVPLWLTPVLSEFLVTSKSRQSFHHLGIRFLSFFPFIDHRLHSAISCYGHFLNEHLHFTYHKVTP